MLLDPSVSIVYPIEDALPSHASKLHGAVAVVFSERSVEFVESVGTESVADEPLERSTTLFSGVGNVAVVAVRQ